MITGAIEHRIEALSLKARKLFFVKLREATTLEAAQNDSSQRKRIVAYIQGGKDFSVDQLKANLKKKLPDYMVPSQFIHLETIPLLPNGKINRKQLPKTLGPGATPISVTTKVSENNIEDRLIKIWEDTLGFSPVLRDDNFFEIGGDSILSIQIVAKARRAGIILKANDIFECQTVSKLALASQLEQSEDCISVEEQLIKIWEETLGFSPIHKDDNFFEIGGDSILSIQIIAKARKVGLILKANDLFEHQTIGALSLFAKAETIEKSSLLLEGIVPLSPIQSWFFKDHENAPQYWNQGVRLDNLPTSSEQQVGEVCEYIITQHDALRAQFRNIENKWVQEITGPEQICALEYVDFSKIETALYEKTVLEHTQRVQDQFNLSKGSLFKCIYFANSTTSNDFCILLAHHLVVDAVSWQIIIDDFGTAINEIVANSFITKDAKTNSFKDWTEYLATYAENVSNEEFEYWQSQITKVPSLPFDKESISVIEEQDIAQLHFSFDALTTKALVTANQAFNTRTEELLIAAFIDTIGNWSNHKEIAVGFERHGRESDGTTLNVSKTVGWFTSYFPLKFAYQSDNSIEDQIIATKEKMRSMPNGGIGYGGLRYIKNAFGAIGNPEIVFNFLGTQTRSQSKSGIKSTTLTSGLRDPQSERHYKLEVNIGIIDSVLSGSFSFGKNVHETKTIDLLLNNFKSQIQVLCDHCNQTERSRYTPSDFSDAEISQDDLDSLMDLLT